MKIIILADDRKGRNDCIPEHGLSLYFEHDNKKILIDTAQTNVFIKNAKKLRVSLEKIDMVILTHGHYDHGNGLEYLDNKQLICHPSCFNDRYRSKDDTYNGIRLSRKGAQDRFKLILTEKPYNITGDIVFMGQIPRENDFESKELPFYFPNEEQDNVIDDSGVVIKTDKGLVVISGCAHSGICNTIEYAKKIMNHDKIYAVIGGFHLNKINMQVDKTIKYFKENNIENIYMGHCTSEEVSNKFKEELKSNVQIIGTGEEYDLK